MIVTCQSWINAETRTKKRYQATPPPPPASGRQSSKHKLHHRLWNSVDIRNHKQTQLPRWEHFSTPR